MSHTHVWIEVSRGETSALYECQCGASKLLSIKESRNG